MSQDNRASVPLLQGMVTTAFFGLFIGFVDFLLFEVNGVNYGFQEFWLSKSGFFRPSFLTTQLLVFSALAVMIFAVLYFASLIFRKYANLRILNYPISISILFFSTAVVSVRFLRSGQMTRLLILIAISVMMVLLSHLVERYLMNLTKDRRDNIWRLSLVMCSILFLVVSSFFFAEELYYFFNISSQEEANEQTENSPNILLIVLDTVRADHLSSYGYEESTTPNIDRISQQGTLFLRAFSPAAWTLPAHASIFTGFYPSHHHTDWGNRHLDDDFLTIAEYLRDLGYRTAGFCENPFVSRTYGLTQGFTEFYDMWNRPLIVRAISEISTRIGLKKERLEYAHRTSGLFKRWINHHHDDPQPFFAYINFMAGHLPRYPRAYKELEQWSKGDFKKIQPVNLVPERYYLDQYRLNQNELDLMSTIYDQEIQYLDQNVGRLVAHLEDTGILDNTVLIITSDHGENFGEHGLIEHQFALYNSLIQVPLIIRFPELFGKERIDKNVSTVFLYRTIAELVGHKNNLPEHISIMPQLHSVDTHQPVIAEWSNGADMLREVISGESRDFDYSPFDRDLRCIVLDDHKFIWSSDEIHELYDIFDDPSELNNLHRIGTNVSETLDLALSAILGAPTDPGNQTEAPEIDEATRAALRALGYVK